MATQPHRGLSERVRARGARVAGIAIILLSIGAALLPVGYPKGSHGPVRRKPLRELIYEDVWEGSAPWAADPPGTRFTGGPAT